MSKEKKKNYAVYLLTKNIVEIEVEAEDQEKAIAKAETMFRKTGFDNPAVSVVDGTICFAGMNDMDVWREMD